MGLVFVGELELPAPLGTSAVGRARGEQVALVQLLRHATAPGRGVPAWLRHGVPGAPPRYFFRVLSHVLPADASGRSVPSSYPPRRRTGRACSPPGGVSAREPGASGPLIRPGQRPLGGLFACPPCPHGRY